MNWWIRNEIINLMWERVLNTDWAVELESIWPNNFINLIKCGKEINIDL